MTYKGCHECAKIDEASSCQTQRNERPKTEITIQSLPPEILVECFRHIGQGQSHYNDRERQHDLTVIARVCRAWHGPAQVLLFGSPSCLNIGRASLLDKIIAMRCDLATMATRFAWTARNGLVDGTIAHNIIRQLPNLEKLELGAQLLPPALVPHFASTLQTLPLRTLVIGSPWMSLVGSILPLLPDLVHLKSLDLFNLAGGDAEAPFKRNFTPTYQLTSLSLISIDGLSTKGLSWLLGGTTALKHLRLSLAPPSTERAIEQAALFEPFYPSLRSVDLSIDPHHREPPPTDVYRLSLADALLGSPASPPALRRLALGGYERHETTFLSQIRQVHLSSMTLHDPRLAPDVGTALLEDRLPALKRLNVVNLIRSEPRALDLAWVCAARDVELILERRFGWDSVVR